MTTTKPEPDRFVGSHGHDWCCRPAQLGPPERIDKLCMHWLIVPGPPISCYLVYFPPLTDDSRLGFYHAHPTTWSLHVVLAGHGHYTVDGIVHRIGPGSVMYHGPGVPHCGPWPDVHSEMQILVVQHPAAGHRDKEWVVCPEMGTKDHPRDLAAFVRTFGELTGDQLYQYIDALPSIGFEPIASERWRAYMGGGNRSDEPSGQE